jgi:hypothetical protein
MEGRSEPDLRYYIKSRQMPVTWRAELTAGQFYQSDCCLLVVTCSTLYSSTVESSASVRASQRKRSGCCITCPTISSFFGRSADLTQNEVDRKNVRVSMGQNYLFPGRDMNPKLPLARSRSSCTERHAGCSEHRGDWGAGGAVRWCDLYIYIYIYIYICIYIYIEITRTNGIKTYICVI